MKRILSLFIIMTLISGYGFSYAASSDVMIQTSQKGRTITISGRLDTGKADEVISAMVFERNSAGQASGIYLDDTVVSADGNFSFSFTMPTEKTLTLKALVSSEYNKAEEYDFVYKGSEDLTGVLNLINKTSDAGSLEQVINSEINIGLIQMTISEFLGVDVKKLKTLAGPYTNIYQYILSEKPYTEENFENIKRNFDKGVLIETLNQTDDYKVIRDYISEYGEADGIIGENSSVITEIAGNRVTDRDEIYRKMLNYEIKNPESLKNAYDNAVLLTSVKCPVNGRLDVIYVIENCAGNLGIDLTEYKKLSLSAQSKVAVNLMGKDYLSEEFKTAFNRTVADVAANYKGTGGGSGGGSSSSAGRSIAVPAPTGSPVDNNKSDKAQEQVETGFKDMSEVPWAAEAVTELHKKNVIQGRENGYFEPQSEVKREEFLKLLIEVSGLSENRAASQFEDVEQSAWYAPYVSAGVEKGVIKGVSETLFGTGLNILRQDLVLMCSRAAMAAGAEIEDADPEFSDGSEISDYAAGAAGGLQKAGIITGNDKNEFLPKAFASRAEAAVIVYRLLGYLEEYKDNENDAESDAVVSENANLLKGLGFISKIPGANDKVTRAEFAEGLAGIFALYDTGTMHFADVSGDNPYYSSISAVTSYNYMLQDEQGNFRPDDEIAFRDAVAAVVCALGYPKIQNEGNEISTAMKIGLLEGVGSDESLTGEDMVNLFCNALDCDILSTLENEEKTGNKVLESLHDIKKDKGRVTQISDVGLFKRNVTFENEIVISNKGNDINLIYTDTIPSDYLGHSVKYYYKEIDDVPTLVYIEETKDVKIIRIDAEDITGFDNSVLRYNGNRSVRIDPDAAIVYNNQPLTGGSVISERVFHPQNGYVEIINKGDDLPQIVKTVNYENYVVADTVDNGNNIAVMDIYGKQPLVIEKNNFFVLDETGEIIDITKLSKWDVITVMLPLDLNDTKITGDLCSAGISGNLTAMEYESGYITVANEKCKLTDEFRQYLSENREYIRMGDYAVYYFDKFGEIAAINNMGENRIDHLVYMINLYQDEDENTFIKYLDTNSNIKTVQLREKIKFNDNTVKTAGLYDVFFNDGVFQQQLVLIDFDNEDYINYLYQAQSYPGAKLMTTYVPKNQNDKLKYRTGAYGLGGKMIISGTLTKVFVVPNDATKDFATDDDYYVTDRSYFLNDGQYCVAGYSLADENILEDAVVVYASALPGQQNIPGGTGVLLVDRIYSALNQDEEAATCISGCYKGAVCEMFVDPRVDLSDISSGDAIQPLLDRNNRIIKIMKLFDYKTKTVLVGNKEGGFNDDRHVVFGKVLKVKNGSVEVEVTYNNGSTGIEKFVTNSARYIYDENEKTDKARIASVTEIKGENDAGEYASNVLVHSANAYFSSIIIYK